MFRRIVFSACLAGLLSGLVLTGVQMFRVVPLIIEAEAYEAAESHRHSDATEDASGHPHGKEAWSPADGMERSFWTAFANVATAIGFALLLVALYSLGERVSWQQGLLWGLGGYAVFFLNPSIGLLPEIPGAAAAALGDRQAWWLITVVCTAVGLSVLVFVRHWGWKAAGALLLLVPHIIGAPHPDTQGGSAPQALADAFVMATAVANAIFWLVLGASSAWIFAKLAAPQNFEGQVPAESR
jgi:cobalt transporter subunit CbtA